MTVLTSMIALLANVSQIKEFNLHQSRYYYYL